MLDMCKYSIASQHDSMTQVMYSLGSEERDITNVEVHMELLVRPKSLCKKHKIGKREYKCTQQDLHQN